VTCSVHPEILKSIALGNKWPIPKAPGGLPKPLQEAAGGDAGESTGRGCAAHG